MRPNRGDNMVSVTENLWNDGDFHGVRNSPLKHRTSQENIVLAWLGWPGKTRFIAQRSQIATNGPDTDSAIWLDAVAQPLHMLIGDGENFLFGVVGFDDDAQFRLKKSNQLCARQLYGFTARCIGQALQMLGDKNIRLLVYRVVKDEKSKILRLLPAVMTIYDDKKMGINKQFPDRHQFAGLPGRKKHRLECGLRGRWR